MAPGTDQKIVITAAEAENTIAGVITEAETTNETAQIVATGATVETELTEDIVGLRVETIYAIDQVAEDVVQVEVLKDKEVLQIIETRPGNETKHHTITFIIDQNLAIERNNFGRTYNLICVHIN